MSRMTEEVGRVLGGRYRIIAPIGRGASAQVFLADDVRLRRRVAVKMLHAALAEDTAFIRRFQAEAQAAAALNHPHVMAVYDWGQDDDHIPYLVLEYLGGGSLRGVLDRGARLTPSQALAVGLEATRALDYAHRQGFVHRDIKPANLLFGEEGRLRIADFGLARALAEAAWTEPQGAVMGTARYASPEQAQGLALGGEADVYSLSLVLVEAVTGSVPFATDTTIGTLMARVGHDLEVPDDLGPLRSAVERAGRADPAERLDAHGLGVALMAAAELLPPPQPLPLAGATPDAVVDLDADPTLMGSLPSVGAASLLAPTGASGADIEVIDPGPGSAAPADRDDGDVGGDDDDDLDVPSFMAVGTAATGTDADPTFLEPLRVRLEADGDLDGGQAAPATASAPVEQGEDQPPDEQGRTRVPGRRRRWVLGTLLVLLLLTAAAAAGALVRELTATATHTVPVVVGQPVAEARAELSVGSWEVSERHVRRDATKKGQVLAVRPVAGTDLAEGEPVVLTVSDGPTIVAVPAALAGMPQADAQKALNAVGLFSSLEERYDEEVAAGTVIGVKGGTVPRLEKGSTVPLVVSKGPEPRTVPQDLPGRTADEAAQALADVQLQSTVDRQYSDSVPEGVVIGTAPGAGAKAERDSTVTLVVSRGPRPVAVPDVAKASTIQEAAALLRAAGLVPGSVSGPVEGTPSATSPGAGTLVKPGSTVDIVLKAKGKGKANR